VKPQKAKPRGILARFLAGQSVAVIARIHWMDSTGALLLPAGLAPKVERKIEAVIRRALRNRT